MKIKFSVLMLWLALPVCIAAAVVFPDVEKLFNELPSAPTRLDVKNKGIGVNNEGGHIQGIQPYTVNGKKYLFFSGSSTSYGYLAVAEENRVEKLHVLTAKPFKHAGGFQIEKNWLAVGIEDDDARNVSKVQVYKLGADPLADLPSPAAVIERKGAWQRATAGAVAVHQLGASLLVVAGCWDAAYLDFYRADNVQGQDKISFRKTGEFSFKNCSKQRWVDTLVNSYQSVNLFQSGQELFLAAFASDDKKTEDVVDVFHLENYNGNAPTLTKIISRRFKGIENKATRFGWGAGLSFDEHGLAVYSSGSHITEKGIDVSVYARP